MCHTEFCGRVVFIFAFRLSILLVDNSLCIFFFTSVASFFFFSMSSFSSCYASKTFVFNKPNNFIKAQTEGMIKWTIGNVRYKRLTKPHQSTNGRSCVVRNYRISLGHGEYWIKDLYNSKGLNIFFIIKNIMFLVIIIYINFAHI